MLQGHFLGGFRITVNDTAIGGLTSRKSRALLAYLMLNPDRAFGRQALAETLWGETRAGDIMKALRQELWIIRRAFRDTGIDPDTHFSFDGEDLRLKTAAWVDAVEFEDVVEPCIRAPDGVLDNAAAAALETAVAVYSGDLLPGLYDDWCLFPRETLRDKYIIAVERLMAWHAHPDQANWGAALIYGRRLLYVDPLLEHVHRDVMRFHYARGDRPAALRQFARCKRILRRELTIEPMAETVALHDSIRQENDADIIRRAVTNRERRDRKIGQTRKYSPAALSALDAVRHDLDKAGRRIDAIIRGTEKR